MVLNCYFNICPSYLNFHSEIKKIKQVFSLNGYPKNFIDSCICSFLDKIFSAPAKISSAPQVIYFALPYTGKHVLQVQTQVCRLCSSAFSHIDLWFIFCPSVILSHSFTFKNRILKGLKSCVVYQFKCRCCSTPYVSQTSWLLHMWVSDHLGISALTGKKCASPSPSSTLSHHLKTEHSVMLDNFQILTLGSSLLDLLVRESLLIKKLNLSLNANLGSIHLSLCWFYHHIC